jgi:hypothetical protein
VRGSHAATVRSVPALTGRRRVCMCVCVCVRTRRLRCPRALYSCVDCGVTFGGTTWREHTACISETEKYQKTGRGALAAPAQPKAKRAAPATAPPPRKKAYWEESTSEEDDEAQDKGKGKHRNRTVQAPNPAPPTPARKQRAAPAPAAEPMVAATATHTDDSAEAEELAALQALVSAERLGEAVRASAVGGVRAHGDALSWRALEMVVIGRLRGAGCDVPAKALRKTIRNEVLLTYDAARQRAVLEL